MKQKIQIRKDWPTKLEFILLGLLLVTVFFTDICENKVLDKGINYQPTVFGDFKIFAINGFWIGIFTYLVLFIILMLIAITSRKTNYKFDAVVSMIAVFGLGFLMSGFLADFHTISIPFFTLVFKAIDFYHIGIAIVLAAPVILIFTD